MINLDIRDEMTKARVFHWEVARQMGIHPVTFSVKLRHELSDADKAKIRAAIAELTEAR